MKRINAVAWDMDGCAADSEVVAMPIAVAAAADYAQQQKPGLVVDQQTRANFVQSTMGKTIAEIGDYVGESYGVHMPKDLQAVVTARTIKTLEAECKPSPGALETMQAIKDSGLSQWIATSSAPDRVVATIGATGIDKILPKQEWDWFSAKVTKPDPEVYQRSIATRGFKPEEVLAIEDSPTGVKAAKAAGIGYIVGYYGGSHIPETAKAAHAATLLGLGVDKVIRDLRELPGIIADLNAAGPVARRPGAEPAAMPLAGTIPGVR